MRSPACPTLHLPFALLALLALPFEAGASYLGSVLVEHPSVSHLANGTRVHLGFDYKIDAPEGARFAVIPHSEGASLEYTWSGCAVIPQGTGQHEIWCTIPSEDVLVDQYLLRMLAHDSSSALLDLYVPALHAFSDHGISNIEFSHGRGSTLPHDMDLDISFDYASGVTTGVRIYARPFTDGVLSTGYNASGSALLPPTGSFSQSFRFPGTDADVDQVRFQMLDESNVLLLEFFVNIDYHWRSQGLMNFEFIHPSPGWLEYEHNVECSFDYWTDEVDGVRIRMYGLHEGAPVLGNMVFQGSPVEPGGDGNVQRWTRIFEAGDVMDFDALRFIMETADYSETLLQVELPAEYHYGPHGIVNIELSPAAPAILTYDDYTWVSWDYRSSLPDSVRFGLIPLSHGDYLPHWWGGGDLYGPVPAGSVVRRLRIAEEDGPVTVQKFRLLLIDPAINESIFWVQETARHHWGPVGIVSTAGQPPSAAVILRPNHPNPFNPKTTLSFRLPVEQTVRLAVYDAQGRLVRELLTATLPAGEHSTEWDGCDRRGEAQPSGVYFYRLDTASGPLSGKAVLLK